MDMTPSQTVSLGLSVTPDVVRQSANRPDQRQIRVTPIQPWASYRRRRVVKLRLSNGITLVQGDNSAIWGSHNGEDFDDLFRLLARNPGEIIRIEAVTEQATLDR